MNKWKIFNHTHLRSGLLQRFANVQDGSVLFLQGGHQQQRDFVDTDIPFRVESNFFYVTGVQDPECAAAINLKTKEFCLFVPHLDDDHALWCGDFPSNEEYKQYTGADKVVYTADIEKVLFNEWQVKTIFTLKKMPKIIEHLSKQFESIDNHKLYTELTQCRLRKQESEIKIMQTVGKISAEAHKQIMQKCRPNMYEYELESFFTSYVNSKGCKHLAYPSIIAGDDRGATLHYVNNDKLVKDGSLLLVDAGAELDNYASDITRTFPINGKFSQEQREIYEVVLAANKAVIDQMKPGVKWVDMHRLAEKIIAEGLIKLGIITGSLDEVLANHVQAIFFPHGLGHSLGLDVHDPPNRDGSFTPINEPGIRYLRVHATLEEGMVLTVEPGIYFIERMIKKAYADEKLSKFLNKEKLDKYLKFGGIRIEDNVLVTKTGNHVFTSDVPKEVAEIEALMQNKL